MICFEPLYGPGLVGGLILDVLRLVQDHMAPGDGRQILLVPLGEGVGGDDDVRLRRCLQEALAGEPVQAMMQQNLQARREALQFSLPVAGHGHGADEKGGFGTIRYLSFPQQEGYQLHGLPQAHVVGEARAKAETVQILQPGDAPQLVGPQCALEVAGRLDRFHPAGRITEGFEHLVDSALGLEALDG